MQNGNSEYVHIAYVHDFAHLVPIFFAQSVLINKISASELSRKFIKSALLVGVSFFYFPSYYFRPPSSAFPYIQREKEDLSTRKRASL